LVKNISRRAREDNVAVSVESDMLRMMMFGIAGGIIGVIITYPYGYTVALMAYCLAGSLFFLIPSVLREPRRHEPARMIVQRRSSL
jgi:ABC-type enterochelin transport system permease subunit